jgi:hypothetical protein
VSTLTDLSDNTEDVRTYHPNPLIRNKVLLA